LRPIAETLDPVLVPLGFGRGQAGRDLQRGQVIFCRGLIDSVDGGCVDLVVDVEATPAWRITDVCYWGFPSDRCHLPFDRGADLAVQLAGLVEALPRELG
jgi:hypothetical protein